MIIEAALDGRLFLLKKETLIAKNDNTPCY
jgi:hypothetical protein